MAALADGAVDDDASSAFERVLSELDWLHDDESPGLDTDGVSEDRDILDLGATTAIESLVIFGVDALLISERGLIFPVGGCTEIPDRGLLFVPQSPSPWGMTEELVLLMLQRSALVLGIIALLSLGASPARADTTVIAQLAESNGSGVTGTASLTTSNDGGLRVVIHARGMVPNAPHAQHIHGSSTGGHFMCPTMESDLDDDGLLTNEEASGEYGDVFMALTTKGDASAESGLAVDRMPVADSAGRVGYDRTFLPDEVPEGLVEQLSHLHVVQHGIDVNDNGRYDMNGAGVSTFADNLGVPDVPEEVTDPASCGVVTGAMAPTPPKGGPETGGADSSRASLNVPLAVLGGLLLVGSLALLWGQRRRDAPRS